MNKSKILLVIMVLLAPMFATVSNAADIREHIDRLELGVSAGAGFYVGEENPVAGSTLLRVQTYDVLGFGEKEDWGWPGIETFGFMVGYRFDARWHLKVQTTRQRLCFAEYSYATNDKLRNVYYNAMWHVDAMAEFNMLNLGNVMLPKQGLYSVVPYIGFGFGVTMFNKTATLRKIPYRDKVNDYDLVGPMYPRVGFLPELLDTPIQEKNPAETPKFQWNTTEVGVGVYIPVAFGVKWRASDNVQLKGTFQYNFYLTPGNLAGGSYDKKYAPNSPEFDDLVKKFGSNHDCMFSLTAIFNLGKWYEDRLITY